MKKTSGKGLCLAEVEDGQKMEASEVMQPGMHCTRWSPCVSFEASQSDVACMAMFVLAMLLYVQLLAYNIMPTHWVHSDHLAIDVFAMEPVKSDGHKSNFSLISRKIHSTMNE